MGPPPPRGPEPYERYPPGPHHQGVPPPGPPPVVPHQEGLKQPPPHAPHMVGSILCHVQKTHFNVCHKAILQFCFPFAQGLVDGIVNVSMLIGSFCGCNLACEQALLL